MVLNSHWDMGNLGSLHLSEGTLRPGQLWKLNSQEAGTTGFILLPQLSLEEAVRSLRPVGFCLSGVVHVLAAEGVRGVSPSKAPQCSSERLVCRDAQDCVGGEEKEKLESSRLPGFLWSQGLPCDSLSCCSGSASQLSTGVRD